MRKFLAASLIFAAFFISGCNSDFQIYERSEKLMGTIITLKANGSAAKLAVDESFAELFNLVEKVNEDVKKLNEAGGTGEFVKISPEVFEMLKLSQKYAELSGGAFDVTVGAAVDLWKNARKTEKLPTAEEISAVQKLVGFRHLELNALEKSARLDLSGVKINLGGVGKGYGVDLVRKIFSKYGVDEGLIDFGTSSIFAFGKKRIGVKSPGEQGVAEVVELENAAISTSGDYENFFVLEGRRYPHILNPQSCQPADSGIVSATITVKNFENCGAIADILSTTIFILGEDGGKDFLRQLPFSTEAILISKSRY